MAVPPQNPFAAAAGFRCNRIKNSGVMCKKHSATVLTLSKHIELRLKTCGFLLVELKFFILFPFASSRRTSLYAFGAQTKISLQKPFAAAAVPKASPLRGSCHR